MTWSLHRFAPSLVVLLLGCTAMSGGANAGWFDDDDKPAATDKDKADPAKAAAASPATDLEGSVRQAQMLRLAGNYDEAIHHLSQIMMVASDDPRVISEYGKTLAAMGRSQDAVQFLTRATQLSPGDWSVYSALGVADDQLGKQPDAKDAYEHALQLRPGEPSVLINYALSRLLAHDPDGARRLAARAQAAGGAGDPKIARNITMINDIAGSTTSFAVVKPAPAPAGPMPAAAHPVATAFTTAPAGPNGAPRPLVPASGTMPVPTPASMTTAAASGGVVMQQVPVDPLAGPFNAHARLPHPVASAKPAPKAAHHDAAPKTETAAAKPKDPIPGLRMSANAY